MLYNTMLGMSELMFSWYWLTGFVVDKAPCGSWG